MTTLSGYHVVKAPCCGMLYSKTAYGSINMMSWERWSDGLERGKLYSNPQSVCHCACGQFFLTKDAEQIDYVRQWYTGDQSKNPENEPARPNPLPYVFQEDAFELTYHFRDLPGGKIEAYIRLLVWQALNDKDRKKEECWSDKWALEELRKVLGREFTEKKPNPWDLLPHDKFEAFKFSNLEKLIPLLKSSFPKDHLLVGNAYRAMGDHLQAIKWFSLAENESPKTVQHLIKEAEAGNSKVVRIEPPEWLDAVEMPEPWVNTKRLKNPIELSSKSFWFKIFGMLNQVWALIEPLADSESVTVYWIDDNASIIESRVFESENLASAELECEGFKLFEEEPDVWEMMCPPGGPYSSKIGG